MCETPHSDGHHLANHVAFTAILGDDDHETWLDEQLPGWGEHGEAWLADRVVELAPEREFPQVFDDTVGVARSTDPAALPRQEAVTTSQAPDAEIERILAEARELTLRRWSSDAGTDDDDGEAASDGRNDETGSDHGNE